MPTIFNSSKTGDPASAEALEHKEGEAAKPTVDKVASDSAKKAGNRMKRNEENQGIFTE